MISDQHAHQDLRSLTLRGSGALPEYISSCITSSNSNPLVEAELQLKCVREELAALTKRAATLRDVEDKLTALLRPYQEPTSSFCNLPDDIMREIFFECLPSDHNPIISSRHSPLVLTHISQRTRAVALSTPKLWAAVHIPVAHSRRSMERRVNAVKEWLLRSGSYPLTVSVYEGPSSTHLAAEYFDPLLEILLPSASRWRSLSIHVSFLSIKAFFKGLEALNDLPLLRSFSLKVTEKLWHGADPQALFNNSAMQRAPFLQEVELFTSTSICMYGSYKLEWYRLMHLSLGSDVNPIRMECAGQILQCCPHLRTVALYLIKYAELPPICLPEVTSMVLGFAYGEWMLETPKAERDFQTIDLPALERITYDATYALAPLIGILTSSDGRIKHLSISNLKGPLHLVECLLHCPFLISLSVRDVGNSILPPMLAELKGWYNYLRIFENVQGHQYLLHALTPDVDILNARSSIALPPTPLCTYLQFLSITDHRACVSVQQIRSFVSRRFKIKHPSHAVLHGLVVDVVADSTDKILTNDDFSEEVAAGLRLFLDYKRKTAPQGNEASEGIFGDVQPNWWPYSL